jgi:D-alanyl-lipoteichoic acid acyltransferase DltB (MBOAT superfamily)
MAFVPAFILILGATILVDYFAGIWIEKSTGKTRRAFLLASIIVNVGFLAFFKYFNFANENIAFLAKFLHWNYPIQALSVILPIGLSFHTFQAMSYTIEVYRGNQKAERDPGVYALYVMFYPQLVAGPIERPQHLIHQFYEKHDFDYDRVTNGLKLMGWGLFKKTVIADRLALVVNQVYNCPNYYEGLPLVLATVFFAFQIYCDFSGYTDIAIGAAEVMGFRLMRNFNRPYFSKSIPEFWQRWHISLSTWFRDYVYIPMGGNRVSKKRWRFNIMITFFLSGLWHGANWTYIIWGCLNGFYMICSYWTNGVRVRWSDAIGLSKRPGLHRIIRLLLTFVLTCFAWIFFRARNTKEAFYVVSHIFRGLPDFFNAKSIKDSLFGLGLGSSGPLIAFLIILLMGVHMIQRSGSGRQILSKKPAWIRWAVYYGIIFGILLFGITDKSQFIYFQF